jgi:methylated-DNA-[protein]-cysteine S-methyltransferase
MTFNHKVWQLCKKIPKGKVTTYKELAKALNTKAYQAVGNAMNKNPYGAWTTSGANMVPCHRVINSDGNIGGFARGQAAKIALLRKEGIDIKNNKIDLKRYLFSF